MSDERDAYDGEGAGRGRGERASGLPEELRALGRTLDVPGAGGGDGSETMVERVLAQILAQQVPVPVAEPRGALERLRSLRRWARLRWRSLTATLCGLLAVLVLTPPVRAAVVDWFDFGGVEVRYDPSAVPSSGAEVPGCGRSVSLAEAERWAGFEPVVPDGLGVPDAVQVSREPQGRFLTTLCWREQGRTIRLDEFPARLDIGFTKTLREQPEWLRLDPAASDPGLTGSALWFPRPHLLSFWLVDGTGAQYTREVRTAGPTLLWMHDSGAGEMTLRLEGVASKGRALEIARSVEMSAK